MLQNEPDISQFLGGTMKQPHETFNLPDAYHGKNQHLEDVLDFMIRKEDEFYTQRLLPWQHTDQLHVNWDIFTFNRSIMDVEPEQGIPRLVTSEMDTKSDNLLRRGLAFIIEHGFMTTERGRRTFMLNLQQITDAVHTTAYHGVMTALLNADDVYAGSTAKKHVRLFMKKERNRWACVQKSHKGLYVLDAELKYEMARKQVVPNTWVFPPKMSIYLDMAPPEQTEYQLKGPLAAGNLEEDRTNKGISWRGTSVFESQPFDVEFTDEPEDLLSQQRQCGEYFHFKTTFADRQDPANSFIQIYDAGSDRFEKITLDQCREHDMLSHAVYWADQAGALTEAQKKPFNLVSLHGFEKDAPQEFLRIAEFETRRTLYAAFSGLHPPNAFGLGGYAANAAIRDLDLSLNVDTAIRRQAKINNLVVNAANRKCLVPAITGAVRDLMTQRGMWGTICATYPNPANAVSGLLTLVTLLGVQIFTRIVGNGGEYSAAELQGLYDIFKNGRPGRPGNDGVLALANAGDADAAPFEAAVDARHKLLEAERKSRKSKKAHELDDVRRAEFDRLLHAVFRVYYQCLHQLLTYIYSAQALLSPDVDYIIFRPFQTYRMSSALLAAGGSELGSTFHGHHDFQLSDDIIRKVHVGHYTHYSKSVVKQPKRFTVARHVYAQEYMYGESLDFYDFSTLNDDANEGELGKTASLLVFSINKPSRALTHVINVAGALNVAVDPNTVSSDTKAIHTRIKTDIRLSQFLVDYTKQTRQDSKFDTDEIHFNGDCFPGAVISRTGSCIQKNMGHWGDLTYPGCMRVREGEIMHIEKEKVLKPGHPNTYTYTA